MADWEETSEERMAAEEEIPEKGTRGAAEEEIREEGAKEAEGKAEEVYVAETEAEEEEEKVD